MTDEQKDTPMNRPEVLRALRMGHDEIIRLKRYVAELEPKAHAYDTIAQMTRLTINEPMHGYGEDPAWVIKSLVERIVSERDNEQD